MIWNGEGGIRTLVKVTPKQHFQCCAFNHSATSPENSGISYYQSKRYIPKIFLTDLETKYFQDLDYCLFCLDLLV